LNQTFGWGPQDFLRCNLNGLKFAPVDERVREELVARLKEAYGQEKF
jgi:hypothetical protein